MSARVTLEVVRGPLAGQKWDFVAPQTVLIGRGEDCHIQVPLKQISRHHCALEINPPQAVIRDLGSLNGTFLGDSCIGQRGKGTAPEDGALLVFEEYALSYDDQFRLGTVSDGLTFRVSTYVPARCANCHRDFPQINQMEWEQRELASRGEQTRVGVTLYQCPDCQRKARPTVKRSFTQSCVICGDEFVESIGQQSQGEPVCAKCLNDENAQKRRLQAVMDLGMGLNQIKEYVLLQKIGEGGCGAVYLARHRQTHQKVALKVMLPHIAADEDARRRFEREIENTRALSHPNVVKFYEEGRANGIYFFTMEYCEAGNIADLMKKRGGRLSVMEATSLIFQALEGLKYAHQAKIPRVRLANGNFGPGVGLVHRDIKPGNLLLSGSGYNLTVKVGDYGMAKAFEQSGLSGVTRRGMAAGTYGFMPRQQIAYDTSFRDAQPEVDVWATAATLYFMLTGKTPRDFPDKVDGMKVVLEASPIPIRKRRSDVPSKLAHVIDEALVDNPKLRITSAAEFKRRLEAAL